MSYEWTVTKYDLEREYYQTSRIAFQEVPGLFIYAELVNKNNIIECYLFIHTPEKDIPIRFRLSVSNSGVKIPRIYNYNNEVENSIFRNKKLIDLSLIKTYTPKLIFTTDPDNVRRLMAYDKIFADVCKNLKLKPVSTISNKKPLPSIQKSETDSTQDINSLLINKFNAKINHLYSDINDKTVRIFDLETENIQLREELEDNRQKMDDLYRMIVQLENNDPIGFAKYLDLHIVSDKLAKMDYNDVVKCESIIRRSLNTITETINEKRLCQICLDNVKDVVLIPCNHCICCNECTQIITTCPVCLHDIESIDKIYI